MCLDLMASKAGDLAVTATDGAAMDLTLIHDKLKRKSRH